MRPWPVVALHTTDRAKEVPRRLRVECVCSERGLPFGRRFQLELACGDDEMQEALLDATWVCVYRERVCVFECVRKCEFVSRPPIPRPRPSTYMEQLHSRIGWLTGTWHRKRTRPQWQPPRSSTSSSFPPSCVIALRLVGYESKKSCKSWPV